MNTAPALTVCKPVPHGNQFSSDDPPFVDTSETASIEVVSRIADKVRALALARPALVRLLEWQIDQELEHADEEA